MDVLAICTKHIDVLWCCAMPTKPISIFKAFHTAERQTALRKQSNTNTGWSTQPHLFPGTATASGSNRNTEQHEPALLNSSTQLLLCQLLPPSERSGQGLKHPPLRALTQVWQKVHKEPLSTNSGITSPANPLCGLALMEVPLEIFRKMVFDQKKKF